MYLHQTFIFLCGVYICGAGYGTYGYYGPTPQSDVEAPSYVPPYIRNNAHGFSYPHNYRTKNAYSGTKTAYSGTKTAYIPRKTGYAGTKTHYAPVNGYNENSWSQENVPNQRPFISGAQEMGPKCEIECKNNGICVDTNTCKCPPNFHGTYCEFEKKPCLVYPPLPMNSIRKCSTEYCTVTCMEGHKFIDGTTVANMRCVGGEWQPTRADFSSIPDCTPECDPPCLNGGVCLSVNTCQCSAEYRGPQCQYSASACDIRKLAFNGGYNCSGDGEQFSCTLSCPAGADFSTPPASLYTCLYSTGVFMPQPIPHCVFNQVIVITPSNRPISSTFYEVQNLRNITTSESVHLTPESATFGAGSHKPPSHQVIVVQDFTPKGGACLTWAGVHYKTFDGKIYSFQSPCQHILVRDSQEHKYTVAVRNPECQRHDYCPSELVVYLDDKMYALSVGEDGAVLFRNTKRLIPIPASLPGIRVSMPSDQVFVNLDALGVTIKWDTNNIIVVEGTLLLWNKTEGLCGTLDGNPENDFRIKDGTVAKTKSMMVASWQVNKIGDICDSRTAENSACASKSDEDMKKALQFCTKVFSKDKFRKCSKVMDVSLLLEACQWDYCACTTSLSPEECACKTVSVYAKECLRHGVEEMKTWRDSDTCPMQCPDGKIYRSCGTDTQPSCAFPLATKSDNSSCVEGCFCPDGLFLEGGRCIPKVECPCRVRNQSFPPGTVLKKSCNTCTCQAGEWICTQVPCGARCSAVGDPHYTTFDGLRYDFMGACTYTLLQTENVTVEVENVACSGSITEAMNLAPYKGDGKPSCTKAVNVLFHGAHIHMKQGGFILVNGKEVSSLPVNVGDIRIRAASSLFIIVQLPIKVDLWWDGNTRVFVDVPPEFHQSTKGLCGTFNLNQKDDFLTPEGDVEQSAFAFANKWKTREFCNDVAIKEPEHPCKANIENKEAAEKYCSVLKSALFESCHWYVDVQPYYENCLYDMCACDGDASRCLCPILGDYAMACAASGVYVQWRYNVKECEISCSGGQEYTVCADSCLRTCSDVALASKLSCKSSCVEGCACPPGQVLDSSNVCVPVALCPCFHKGMQFNPGYKEVRAGARERELCTCVGARWDCEPATPDEIARYPPAEDLRSNCSAANHREFTTCEVAEPLTCKNMHLARTATTSECRPGCQCKKGYVLDTGSGECILPTQCPCHHGGRSYADGESMQEECNTCECRSGVWECSGRPCVGVCAAWGDSHLSTFDGVHYDFEGVCSYLLAKGAMDDRDGFSVEIQNVPCGTTGATCSKSVTLKVSNADGTEESASLAQGAPLPDLSGLKRIKLRIAGAYVFLDVPSLAMSLQWDRELRVYIKLDSIWKNRVKGLCGNYNSDMRDDFQTPSGGGFAETSALIFADSWKLKPTCPKPQEVPDHCQQRPQRKQWAEGVCGALKRFPFTLCHSEVAVGAHVRACEADACACDAGDDCRCACAAIAHYAHACAARGVTFQWRSQELCPMQCDGECSNYNSCMSPCPPETCDNTLDYAQLKTVCEKETCVEGCKPKKACPEGAVYSNSTLTECVPRSKCRPVCMTLEDGKEVFEGEVIEEDDCHTCRCSKKTKVCTGQPCSTTATSPASPTSPQSQDEGLKCVGGWTPWLNRGPPEIGAEGASIENEPLPRSNELVIGSPMCKSDMMKKIECRTVGDHKTAKETGLDVECSLERGLVCREQESTCPDFEIRVFCDCEETFQCLDSTHPNHPHPTDCRKFYECTPEPGNLPGQKHAVVKECDAGLLYNPVAMVCDWPASVIALRPECGTTTTTGFQETTPLEITATQKPGEPRLMTSESSIGTIKSTAATTPLPNTSEQCPPGQVYSPCAYPCDNLCDHFLQTLLEKDQCMPGQKCVKACIDESVANVKCEFGSKWRDEKTCVPIKDCTCYDEGQIVKPGGVVVRGCEKCQCLDNALHCDTSDCVSIFTSAGPTHMSYIIKPQSTTPIVTTTIAPTKPVLVTISSTWTPAQTTTAVPQSSANTTVFSYTTQPTIELTTEQTSAATTLTTQPPLIIKSTTTPPPKCNPDNYKYLLWSDEPLPNSAFTASSVESALYEPQFAELNAHPLDISAGSWTPKTMDANQYIQVELPRREPIYGVIMQGSPLYDEYVTSYEVMYGDDGHVFSTVDGPDGNPKVFRGPVDNSNPVQQMIEPPIEAKFVRIRPLTWKEKIAVRFDVIGCEEPTTTTTPQPTTTAVTTPEPLQCTEPLGLGADLPLESIEVSSNNDARPFLKLDSERGWRPTYSTPREWIMFDFMSPRNITGIKTKGGANGWVTAYNVTYSSNLSLPFSPVVDSNGANQLFPANFDADTVVFSQFRPPIRARYLKLLPIKWSGNLEMRAEPVGCFEPYPTTIAPTPTSSPNASEPSCELCPGIPPSTCNCSAPTRYFDATGCVSRDQCPCVEGFITYGVGSAFRGTNCDECMCKLGGITDCKPVKECNCEPDLVPKLSPDTCECTCEPCPEGSRLCPSSKLCLPLERWCDGLQDCGDDERLCSTSASPRPAVTEPTVVTTVVPTAAAAPPTTTAAPKPLECPKVECPHGYFVQYTSNSRPGHSRPSTSEFPQPRQRYSYQRYYRGGYSKGGFAKGGFSKTSYSKGGFSKGGSYGQAKPPQQNQVFLLDKPNLSQSATPSKEECAQFKCIPKLPPPPRPGSTPAPVICSAPACPPHYTLKLEAATDFNKCPLYVCVPPVERPVYCNVTGRTFTTFDGAEYKYDVCFHILARENRFNSWTVLVRKKCRPEGCVNQLMVHQDDQLILVKPNLMIEYDNYEYTVEQTSKICFQKNSFDVDRLGNGVSIKSRKYNFIVLYTTDGDVKIGAFKTHMGHVDGLCGAYDGDASNDRQLPSGRLATSIDQFGRAWAKPGLKPDTCQPKLIPPKEQKKCWDMCKVITEEPISQCGKVLNLNKWRTICLEKTCECAEQVVNGTKRTDEECRCLLMEQLVAECLAADKNLDIQSWRMQMNCPAECPAPLVHYDCYRRRCEPTCASAGSTRRSCPPEDGVCFPGCYCPEGLLRKGDQCVAPLDCLDCACHGAGTPANYATFEEDDLPFLGKCTYLASRDRNETGIHKYQVYATNEPCSDNSSVVCTRTVHVIYEKDVIRITKEPVTNMIQTFVNGGPVFKYPRKTDWGEITKVNGKDVTVLLQDAHVEVTVGQGKMEFGVRVPSFLYANQTEGMCGVCMGYREQLLTSNGTATDDFELYGKSWQADVDTLSQLGESMLAQCGDLPPEPECVPPPQDHNPCLVLRDVQKFGACHALVDPDVHIELCEADLCAFNTTDACPSLERYADECRREGVCLDWRGDLCPYPCESPLVYRNCVDCERTCENNEELESNPNKCKKLPVEGCFCPEGKVRVNNTCIEPTKCFPCDANKEHYAGDEWQEDACTKCTCSKLAGTNEAHVACTKQTCAAPVCGEDDHLVTEPPAPGKCCPTYMCVPKPQEKHCDEPKKMECGFGQVLKQKTTANNCKEFSCECKPASECEPIPPDSEVEIMEPGMQRLVDSSGCCPRAQMVCRPESCPTPPQCGNFETLNRRNDSARCCPSYECELPKDKCVVTLEWEAAPKGGEKLRSEPQTILKNVDEVWLDGPCRSCRCVGGGRGAAAQCGVTECPPLPVSEQFVLEPRPVPFSCCPQPVHVACRHGDSVYKVNETWSSPSNPCESYKCVRVDDSQLDMVTTVQDCDRDCQAGWEYVPAEESSGQCCGKCKPVACVCEDKMHPIGETWTSADFCTNYTCIDLNGTLQVQSSNETCPKVSEKMQKQFVLTEEKIPGKCCPKVEPVACRVDDKIYQINETWKSATDACESYQCSQVEDKLEKVTTVQNCDTECQPGWEYVPSANKGEQCCGKCKPVACVGEGKLHPIGEVWTSTDFCTNYTCVDLNGTLQIQSSNETCPKPSEAMKKQFVLKEQKVEGKCCPVIEPVACRVGDNVYQVGENWTSPVDACESYECAPAEDGKLHRVTTLQACDDDCQPGWEYEPSANQSEQCCGKCKPVACVCEGKLHPIGEVWTSADFCTNYTCVDLNGTLQVQSSNETCPEVTKAMLKQFVYSEEKIAGKCCPKREPTACRVGNEIYQEGQSWRTADPCANVTCARDATGALAHKESAESCVRECPRGWHYAEPPPGRCCGRCDQHACLVDDALRAAGETWQSADNCTTYSCERDGNEFFTTSSRRPCPDVSDCAPENLVNETCCQVCKLQPSPLSTCVPTTVPAAETVGLVRLPTGPHGLCVNRLPITGFKECHGSCDSGTVYNNQTGAHDTKCECCAAAKYERVLVGLVCEDGTQRVHTVASPKRCACVGCGAHNRPASKTGYKGHRYSSPPPYERTIKDEDYNIPEMFARYGETSPRPRL